MVRLAVLAEPALYDTVTKLVENRGTRRADGVEGTTTLSDAIDAIPHIELASTCADSALEAHDLQIVHPGLGQHAVLEEDPVSCFCTLRYQ